ncbi:hypothetical protein FB451DRAFT_1369617 [Mycena latifolia]|nr:hypothetical protein FB451DRAFT_1369617 [Mycena latifolia]
MPAVGSIHDQSLLFFSRIKIEVPISSRLLAGDRGRPCISDKPPLHVSVGRSVERTHMRLILYMRMSSFDAAATKIPKAEEYMHTGWASFEHPRLKIQASNPTQINQRRMLRSMNEERTQLSERAVIVTYHCQITNAFTFTFKFVGILAAERASELGNGGNWDVSAQSGLMRPWGIAQLSWYKSRVPCREDQHFPTKLLKNSARIYSSAWRLRGRGRVSVLRAVGVVRRRTPAADEEVCVTAAPTRERVQAAAWGGGRDAWREPGEPVMLPAGARCARAVDAREVGRAAAGGGRARADDNERVCAGRPCRARRGEWREDKDRGASPSPSTPCECDGCRAQVPICTPVILAPIHLRVLRTCLDDDTSSSPARTPIDG